MKLIKNIILVVLLLPHFSVWARGGDDAGNGGFAYKQSIKILKLATEDLEKKIIFSDINDLKNYPERREILRRTLSYDNLRKYYFLNQYRDGKKLAMNYGLKPEKVIVLKPYYEAFAGKTDAEIEDSSLEVQKRLLHEASHIWGYKEVDAEKFSITFLAEAEGGSKRPTNAIDIKSDFCSCLNGKSDIINDCEAFCSGKPNSENPILYVNMTVGPEIALNTKLGNVQNWCSIQLPNDYTVPQCTLTATDGNNTISNIPVTVSGNSFSANIQQLAFDRAWIIKLVESKTGSNAQSKEFQVRRKKQSTPEIPSSLKITPISQYMCIAYGGKLDSAGNIYRTSSARSYYYYPHLMTPPPMPPIGNGNLSMLVCHDEDRYPGSDSAEYERLELVSNNHLMWDFLDPRFNRRSQDGGKILMNKILEDRLSSEHGINMQLDLFHLINFPNRPFTQAGNNDHPMGVILVPFVNFVNGKTYCPTRADFLGADPLMQLLGEYVENTQALYLAEKEGEVIEDGAVSRTVYATMFIAESKLAGNAFYIENGTKILADKNSFHFRTIHYYWPLSSTMDPLIAGNRKLFTIKSIDQLSGSVPTGHPVIRSSDKRLGCIPN